jgi:olefin beta-lactone synthetase
MKQINIATKLSVLAAETPGVIALHFPKFRSAYSFEELNQLVDAYAHGLNAVGVGMGTRTAVMVPPSVDFFALTFALFRIAAIPVLIDPGMGTKNLGVCLADAQPEAFVGIPKAHLARRLFGWGKSTIRTTINTGRRRFFCTRSLQELSTLGGKLGRYQSPPVNADDTAAILFTSGSTGVAKGAVYTHGIFTAQVEMLQKEYGIQPGEVDLCTFPLFALFGPALGMTCVIPDMDFARPAKIDPAKTLATMEKFRATNFFGSPAVLRRLSEHLEKSNTNIPTLVRVISAGAPATPSVLETLSHALPDGVQIYTPYGATEALPVANIGSEEILTDTRHETANGKGVCIGRPFAGMTVKVIRISDEPIAEWSEELCVPDGEVGEIVVRGPVVTKSYYNRDVATKLAKIHDPKTGETLHRMGDVGYFDDRGRLWFCGRKSHRVVTPQGTLYTDMVEPIFTHAFTDIWNRVALVGVNRDGQTHPVLCLEMAWSDQTKHRIVFENLLPKLRELSASHSSCRGLETYLVHPGPFPVDVRHNSKIFREKLAVWAANQLKAQRRTSLGKEGA